MDKPVMEKITPAKAEQYLNRNTGNRKLREGVVEKYAADMRAGNWTECLDPVAFYENGDVADGQHRLWAIVESNTTQEFIIVRNFPRDAGLNVDTGVGRTLVDNARISGADSDLSNELLSVAMVVDSGDRTKVGLPNQVRLAIVNKHREACKWAEKYGPRGRGLRNQLTLGAVARAWYHEENKDRLAQFGQVMTTGLANGTADSAAISLRNYIISNKNGSRGLGGRDLFLKAMNAIHYFMRSKSLTVMRTVGDEAYPLPRGVKPEPVFNKRGSTKVRKAASASSAA